MRCRDLRESYAADEEIFQSLFVKVWLGAFLVALLFVPLFAGEYLLYLSNLIGIAIIAAHGLNILTGFTGQVSLGHAAFVGVGAYTSALLMAHWGVSFWLTLPASGIMAAFIGLIIGIPSLRVKALYLAMATLAAQFILDYLFFNWESVTRGIRGINVPPPAIGDFKFHTGGRFYYITLLLVVLATAFAKNLFRTRVGRAFIAIRDRDLAAELMGVNLFRYKLLSFAVSSFYAGVAGCLWASFMNIVTPEHFPLTLSIQYLAMVIVGGMGRVLGSILGAIFMTLTPEVLKITLSSLKETFPYLGLLFAPLREVIFGTLIILFLIFEPHGLAEIWRRVKNFFTLWPFSY